MANENTIFVRIKEDHDNHRNLLDQIAKTEAGSAKRSELFEEFTKEVKGHASAEEQSLYAPMMRDPETTDETRHSVAEHQELDELLDDLAATDTSSSEWMTKFEKLDHRYRHHIEEEEDDHFPDFEKQISDSDAAKMAAVFDDRKGKEKAAAKLEPRELESAKE